MPETTTTITKLQINLPAGTFFIIAVCSLIFIQSHVIPALTGRSALGQISAVCLSVQQIIEHAECIYFIHQVYLKLRIQVYHVSV